MSDPLGGGNYIFKKVILNLLPKKKSPKPIKYEWVGRKRHKHALNILRGNRKDLRMNVLILFNNILLYSLRARHYCKRLTEINLYNPNNPTREVLFVSQVYR